VFLVNSDKKTIFTCEIVDDEKGDPLFRITADDAKDQPISSSSSSSGVWKEALAKSLALKNKDKPENLWKR
jgi:hypothetical protein